MPSDTGVMPLKIHPHIRITPIWRDADGGCRPRASQTGSYRLAVEKCLKTTHTIPRRAKKQSTASAFDVTPIVALPLVAYDRLPFAGGIILYLDSLGRKADVNLPLPIW